MGFPENEVAADNQRREFEELSRAPGGKIVTSVKNVISLVPGAGPIANAIGLSKMMMDMGLSTVEENITFLGKATATALDRIENKLDTQGVRVDVIAQRYNGPEFVASTQPQDLWEDFSLLDSFTGRKEHRWRQAQFLSYTG
jgi:hypothetical protein